MLTIVHHSDHLRKHSSKEKNRQTNNLNVPHTPSYCLPLEPWVVVLAVIGFLVVAAMTIKRYQAIAMALKHKETGIALFLATPELAGVFVALLIKLRSFLAE